MVLVVGFYNRGDSILAIPPKNWPRCQQRMQVVTTTELVLNDTPLGSAEAFWLERESIFGFCAAQSPGVMASYTHPSHIFPPKPDTLGFRQCKGTGNCVRDLGSGREAWGLTWGMRHSGAEPWGPALVLAAYLDSDSHNTVMEAYPAFGWVLSWLGKIPPQVERDQSQCDLPIFRAQRLYLINSLQPARAPPHSSAQR